MAARLAALSGIFKNMVFPITDAGLSVGRAADNDVSLEDELVGQHHCSIRRKDGRIWLKDGDSKNGTWINGRACSERYLEHGDRIKCGSTTFIYLEHEDVPEGLPEIIENEADRNRHLETLRADYSVREPAAVHYRAVLRAILEMLKSINTVQDRAELFRRVLDLTFEVIPAERGAIALNGHRPGPDPANFVSEVHRERDFDGNSRCILSGTVLREVYSGCHGVLTNNVTPVVCAPLMIGGTIRGVVYLEGASSRYGFEPEHLSHLQGIAELIVTGIREAGKFESVCDARDLLLEERLPDDEMVGSSEAIQKVRADMRRIAGSKATVLISGETGTGKELVARGIHQMSDRRGKPFVGINCAAITESLLESELFGHVKGAFTGAATARKGKFRKADGGTLFLDEIGEMSMEMQTKLLRVLQEREFEPVGSDETVQVDVRIIAATRVDLAEAILQGKFRDDLFYRLKVLTIESPPLRDRKDDIPLLAGHFLAKHAAGAEKTIAPETMQLLKAYSWPGNVRELEGAVQAALVYAEADTITIESLPKSITGKKATAAAADGPVNLRNKGRQAQRQVQRAEILKRLEVNGGSVREAAEFYHISLSHAYRILSDDDN